MRGMDDDERVCEMTDRRISADIKPNVRKDCMMIEVPLRPGAVKTVVTIVLGEDGRVHVAGPMNEPHLMKSLLDRARVMLEQHQATKLVQPVQSLPGLTGQG